MTLRKGEGLPYEVHLFIRAKSNNGTKELDAQLLRAITEHCPDVSEVTSIRVSRCDEPIDDFGAAL